MLPSTPPHRSVPLQFLLSSRCSKLPKHLDPTPQTFALITRVAQERKALDINCFLGTNRIHEGSLGSRAVVVLIGDAAAAVEGEDWSAHWL